MTKMEELNPVKEPTDWVNSFVTGIEPNGKYAYV